MPLKYIPSSDDWERMFKTFKIKDNGLTKAIDDFWTQQGLRSDSFDKGLAQLPKILKLATDMKNSKEAVAAGPNAVKYLAELVAAVPIARKNLEAQKANFAKTGMQTADVQITIVDWNGKSMSSDYVAYVEFGSPGTPTVNTTENIASRGVDLHDIRLKPSGTLYLMVRDPSSAVAYCEGTTDYEFKPGKPVMKFKAIQHSKTTKIRAKTLKEASEKLGVKAEVGLEFEVLKVGGEVTKESEYKEGFEQEVEWEVELGMPTFKDFKQL